MSIDDVSGQQAAPTDYPSHQSHTGKFIVVALVLLALAIGEIYGLSKITSLRDSTSAQQAATRKEVQETLAQQYAAIEQSSAERWAMVKQELEATAKRMGSTGRELNRARALVSDLQKEQQQQVDSLRGELAQKADLQQVGALSQDVTATRSDLEGTKKVLDSTRSDLGMTRTEFGTMIARNHDEIDVLRKMGERDYFEFTLSKNNPQTVAGFVINLKKTNVNRHRFNLNLTVDDLEVEKKDRTINEPIFFYASGSRKPYEIVVNKVGTNQIKGYLSAPKSARETATAR
jgi:hypothetical protein